MNTLMNMFSGPANKSDTPRSQFAKCMAELLKNKHVLTPIPPREEIPLGKRPVTEWPNEKLEEQLKNLSDQFIASLKPLPPQSTVKEIEKWRALVANAVEDNTIDVKDVTMDKHIEANAEYLKMCIKSPADTRYAPFDGRKAFLDYIRQQCEIVNKLPDIRIVPSGFNPWILNVIMRPNTSYLSGVPIVCTLSLPVGFPRTAPHLSHFVRVGTRLNVNYYMHRNKFHFDRSTSCSSMGDDWKEQNLCKDCDKCRDYGSIRCHLCPEEECKALAKEHHEADYYPSIAGALQSYLLFYITTYTPQIQYGGSVYVPNNDYVFEAEKFKTITLTVLQMWGVYFQLQELFENYPDHFPPGAKIEYGKIIDCAPLPMNSKNNTMVSTPLLDIPPEVKAMGWENKNKSGICTYTSVPMTLDETNSAGYSLIIKPGGNLFEKKSGYVVSFILSTNRPPTLHGIGRGVQRTMRWGICGYAMTKMPHIPEHWVNHGSLLSKVFAIWLTFANDQFVVAVQETSSSLPYILSGVPVGRLSSVFRPQDTFYLNIYMKSKTTSKRIRFDELRVTKGVVADWRIPPAVNNRPSMYVALIVQNTHKLIEEALKHIPLFTSWNSIDEKLIVGRDIYTDVWKKHSLLGHSNDGKAYDQLLKHWKEYEAQNHPAIELVIDSLHYDENAAAFHVRDINPPVKSLREKFQHIVVGLMDKAGGPSYVWTHMLNSPSYKEVKLEEPLVVTARMKLLCNKGV